MKSLALAALLFSFASRAVVGQAVADASFQPDSGFQNGFPVSNSLQSFGDHRIRLLLNSEIGTAKSLGYQLPSVAFGPSVELPVHTRFEFQGGIAYSPDRKQITRDGQSIEAKGSALVFASERIGFIATVERNWLWTSQFDKSSWLPSGGLVIRNDYFGPGRLYLTYLFPTGCQWATVSNPCTIQSNRLQGIELRQEVRSGARFRWGFRGGFYHFCDQGNPNDRQAGRYCHLGATAMVTFSLESHLGSKPRLTRAGVNSDDNF